MKIIITGNLGYVGSVLVGELRSAFPQATLVGYDTAYFAQCLTDCRRVPESELDMQMYGDVRDLPESLLAGADAVVQLAAISNDPMGKAFESVTREINYEAGVSVANKAQRAGVKNIVFASSCSVYGSGGDAPRTEESELAPLTAYARSKVDQEEALKSVAGPNTIVTCLRFATACGMSPRLRLDLVLNDFVAGALATGRIEVLSDGSPWRPLIHVRDMARAIEWAVSREADNGGEYLVINAGSNDWNYQVRDLAQAVANVIEGTKVEINQDAAPDKRSYRVSFDKFAALAPQHQPQVGLTEAAEGLKAGLEQMAFADENFRDSDLIRLRVIKRLQETGTVDDRLRWQD